MALWLYTFVQGPSSTNKNFIQPKLEEVKQILTKIPENKDIFSVAGAPINSQGFLLQALQDLSIRHRSTPEIIRSMAEPISKIPGVRIFQVNLFFYTRICQLLFHIICH